MALVINGERVEDAAIETEIMRMRRSGQVPPQAPQEDLREKAKQRVIRNILLHQKAREYGFDIPDEEVSKALDEVMEAEGGREAFLQRNQLTEKDEPRLQARMKQGMRMEKTVEELAGEVDAPTEEEMRGYFNEHRDSFRVPAQIRVSHIVKKPKGPDDETVFNEMCDLRRKLCDGAEFAELADAHSDCSQEPGGDLGFIARGQMVEGFETVVFSMENGEVSPVFMTQFGMHVAKVTDAREEQQQTYEDVQDRIRQHLLNQRKQASLDQCLDELQKEASVTEIVEEPPDSAQGKGAESGGGTSKKKKKKKSKRK